MDESIRFSYSQRCANGGRSTARLIELDFPRRAGHGNGSSPRGSSKLSTWSLPFVGQSGYFDMFVVVESERVVRGAVARL